MANSSQTSGPSKKHGFLFKLGMVALVLLLLLIVAYFVVTSSGFVTGVILPRVGRAMNSQVTATDASVHPFSEVTLANFKVVPNGHEPLLQSAKIHVRYSLSDIIAGKIVVHELKLSDPVITIVRNPDGSSNLDPLTEKKEQKPAEPTEPGKPKQPEKPTQVDIRNVSIAGARVEVIQKLEDGGREVTQVSGFNLNIDRLQNGQPGKMNFAGMVSYEKTRAGANQAAAVASLLAATLNGEFSYALSSDLAPESLQGVTRVAVTKAAGEMSKLANFAAALQCNLTPAEIRDARLQFEQSGENLGILRAYGPFSVMNSEGRLQVELLSIDRRLLNLATAGQALDFNKTKISSTNEIAMKQKGAFVAVNGKFNISDFSVTQKTNNLTSPTLNMQSVYQIDVDQDKKLAVLRQFDLSGTQNQKQILKAGISKPMPISWGEGGGMPEEAALDLLITGLNLGDWRSFAPELEPAGKLDATLHATSRESGKQIALDLSSKLADFGARFGSNQIENANITLSTKAQIQEMKLVDLSSMRVDIAQGNKPAASLTGSGKVNTETSDMDIKTLVEANVPQLLNIAKLADVSASSGQLRFDGRIAQSKGNQTIVGDMNLNDLSGKSGEMMFNRYGAKAALDISAQNEKIEIRKCEGTLQGNGKPGGTFDVSGNYNTNSSSGQVALKLSNLNENALSPFIAPSLEGKQLVSIQVNADLNAKASGPGSSAIKGQLSVSNLVVRAPNEVREPAPLSAQFRVDAGMQKQKLELNQLLVALSPTERAKNQLEMKGQVDLSNTNAILAKLSAQAESLDITPFYNLQGAPQQETNKTETTPAPPAPAKPETEPDPVKLPVKEAVVSLNIGRFYLREVAISNWVGTVKVEGSHVLIQPFQMSLNGGPVNINADLDLGVKGYAYQLAFGMERVPLAPLANSFMEGQPGAYQGTLVANANIKGAGTTGVNLQKTLNGNAAFTLTNANIQIVGPKWRSILVPIATVLRVPEVASSPINWINANLNIGSGVIFVTNTIVASPAFMAGVQGPIRIADVVMNSPMQLPVSLELRRSLAEKANLMPANATNAEYVPLPNFVTVVGTLDKPDTKTDKAAIASLLLRSTGGAVGGEAGKVLRGLGGILGGQQQQPQQAPGATNAPAGTNAPAAPPPNLNQLIDIFKKKK